MIDHLMVRVGDVKKAGEFYAAVLAPLGYSQQMEWDGWLAYGPKGKSALWIGTDGPAHSRIHLALLAPNRAAVDAFHAAALKMGAKDNGAPGLRPYHPDYY